MDEEKNEQEHVNETSHENNKKDITETIRENPWILSTFVIGTLALILLGMIVFGGITGNVVSHDKVTDNLISYAKAQGYDLVVTDISEESGLYKLNVEIDGSPTSLYMSKDGAKIVSGLIPIVSSTPSSSTSTEVPKTDKPNVELYIWSYCPYGVTALGPFSEVASLLKNSADFKVRLYYAGHGDHEVEQNKIQACIQKIAPDKYWAYAKAFATDIYTKCSGDVACDLKESTALMNSLGIDSAAVLSCVKTDGEALTEADYNLAGENGVTGSPTLMINGVIVSAARNAEAYKSAVCAAFNNAPSECSQTLNSDAAATSGSC